MLKGSLFPVLLIFKHLGGCARQDSATLLLQDSAEFGRIGRYYATESMLVWDDMQQKYIADATPSYGKESLEQFFERVMKEGLAGQELGDAAIF